MPCTCQHCVNEVDDDFDVCWNCGSTIDGEKNPDFSPEMEATELPPDGSRSIRCGKCGYRGESQRVQAVNSLFSGMLSIFAGIRGASRLTNHACPNCGETREIYDWYP